MKKSIMFLAMLSLLVVGCNNSTATTNNDGDGTPVEPINPVIHVESVSLNETALKLKKGDSYTLKATVLPENADNKNVTWSSSNHDVVSVVDGIITALKEGEVDIIVKTKDGGKTAKAHVVVEEDEPVEPVNPINPDDPEPEPEEPETPPSPEDPEVNPEDPEVDPTPEDPDPEPEDPEPEPTINYVKYTIDFENCGVTTNNDNASKYEEAMKSIFNDEDTILTSVTATGYCQINDFSGITAFTVCSASSDGSTTFTFAKELSSVKIVASPYKKFYEQTWGDNPGTKYSIDEDPTLIVNDEEWLLDEASETKEYEKVDNTFEVSGKTLTLSGLASQRVFVCSLELEFIDE